MNTSLPFTQDFGRIDRKNSEGFRAPEYTIAHPPGTFRILILGDSQTLGIGVPMEQTYSNILSKLLSENCVRFQVEVIPLASTGHRLADDLIKLLAHGQDLQPDLVLVQVSQDDVDFFSYLSILYFQGIKNRFSLYMQKEQQVYQDDSVDWSVFTQSLEEFKSWSRKNDVPVAFIAFPPIDPRAAGRNFNHYSPEETAKLPFVLFTKAVDEIKNHGFQVDYLMDAFRIRAGDQSLNISDGSPELNTFAHRLIAYELKDFLKKHNLINCEKSKIREKDARWDREFPLRQEAAGNWLDYNASYSLQIRFYEDLSEIFPTNAWLAYELGNAYFGRQLWRSAFEQFSSLTELSGGFAAPQYQLSLCTPTVTRKIALLEDLVKIVPDHTPAMQELSRLYLLQNRIPDACKMFARLIEIPAYQQQYDTSKEAYEKYHCNSMK